MTEFLSRCLHLINASKWMLFLPYFIEFKKLLTLRCIITFCASKEKTKQNKLWLTICLQDALRFVEMLTCEKKKGKCGIPVLFPPHYEGYYVIKLNSSTINADFWRRSTQCARRTAKRPAWLTGRVGWKRGSGHSGHRWCVRILNFIMSEMGS